MNVNYEDLEPIIGAALKSAKTANERIDNLPLPMVFKGTLGTGGTISTLPTASSANEGYVYIVITDGTYAGQSAKAGDTFVSDGSSWVLVPSGDEPSVIDDSVTSTALTWSSSKITNEFGGIVKSFTYTGNGQNTNEISFPTKPSYILSITGNYYQTNWTSLDNLPFNSSITSKYVAKYGEGATTIGIYGVTLSVDEINNKLTITADTTTNALNYNNRVYTVYYI